MNISEPFIRRPVATSLLAGGLFLLGIVAYKFLPVAPVPRVDSPTVQVTTFFPGADPATMASSVAAPLERRFGQISGISEITSVSTLGASAITLQFDLNRNIDGAVRDVQAAINAAGGELPPNLPTPPTYRRINPSDAPIMIMSLTSDQLPITDIYNYADTVIGQRLSQIYGVSQVNLTGSPPGIRVRVDPAALAAARLSLEDVRTALERSNVDAPKGSIDSGPTSFTIESNDQLLDAERYNSIIIAVRHGVPVTLGSLGAAVDSVQNIYMGSWTGQQNGVLLIIYKQADANVIETVDAINAVLPQLKKWLPPTIRFKVESDRTTTIRASLRDVQASLAISVGLVVMVMFFFLRRFWPTFIASVTVPLALAGTFGGMYLCHYSLDNLSLMALTISVGFVVDDAIVVIENVFRFVEMGEPPFQAALKGARQIGFTVISISVSLIAVFIPLLFMGGLIGRLLHEFAVTLSMAIIISAIISLTLTPMMCALFLRAETAESSAGLFYRTTEHIFQEMLAVYEGGLRWVLRHQGIMLGVFALTLVATAYLFATVSSGFFPQQDTGMVMGVIEGAQDISFASMSTIQKKVGRIVMDDPSVNTMTSFIGSTNNSSQENNGRIFISLKPRELRGPNSSADQVIGRLRKAVSRLGGVNLYMQAMQDIRVGGRLSKTQFIYALQCPDLDELNTWAPKVLGALRKIPLLKDVTSDQFTGGLQANVIVDRDAASRLGVTSAAIDDTLYDAFGQRQVSILYKRYNEYRVVLEADPHYLRDIDSLAKIYVKSTTGALVPLNAFAKFSQSNAYLSVSHQGQFPAVSISFNLAPGGSLGDATALIQKTVAEMHLPASIQANFQGTAQVFQASLVTMPFLILAALIAVYVVLGMLYESLVHPITIVSTLPSAALGALLALMYYRLDLSIVSAIGIILLMGIVKKNAIMMLDFALEAERHENLSPEEAIYKACVIRFRPIIMTTMAALFGAFPLAFGMGVGSELRRPLGVAVAGGLVFSQVLTLYSTPVVYLMFEHLRIWVRRLRSPEPLPAGAPAVN